MCIPDGSGVQGLPVSGGAVRGAGLCGSTGWRYPRLSGGFGRGAPGPQVVILAEMDWLIDEDGMVPVNDSNRT